MSVSVLYTILGRRLGKKWYWLNFWMEGPTNASFFDLSIMKHCKESAWLEAMTRVGFAKVHESLPTTVNFKLLSHICTHLLPSTRSYVNFIWYRRTRCSSIHTEEQAVKGDLDFSGKHMQNKPVVAVSDYQEECKKLSALQSYILKVSPLKITTFQSCLLASKAENTLSSLKKYGGTL